MACGPITWWQIEGEKVEVVTDFFSLGSKITADGDCSHEVKKWVLLGRKAMTNLDRVLKSRDITLPTKVCLVKAMVFQVVTWELDCKEGRTPKNWCLWTVVLEKTPGAEGEVASEDEMVGQHGDQTSQSWGKSTLNIHWKDWCLSWSSSILVMWCAQTTHWKSPWCWERSRTEGEEGVRGWDGWMASPI